MGKPNKDGWIRHRGGKCPVELGSVIDVRYRDGKVIEKHFATENPSGEASTNAIWQHRGNSHDIMAYRLHKTADQPVIELPEGYGEVITATLDSVDGPFEWRDRITEIDASVEALEEERASLVQRLEAEGFRLIERAVQPVEDMSDWRNWKVGDQLKAIGNCGGFSFSGEIVKILRVRDDGGFEVATLDNPNYGWFFTAEESKTDLLFHSRPSK